MIIETTLDTTKPAVSTDTETLQASAGGFPTEGSGLPFEDDEALLEEALLEALLEEEAAAEDDEE